MKQFAWLVVIGLFLVINVPAQAATPPNEASCDVAKFEALEENFNRMTELRAMNPQLISEADYKLTAMNYIAMGETCFHALHPQQQTEEDDHLHFIDDGAMIPPDFPRNARYLPKGWKWGDGSPFSARQDGGGPGISGGTLTYSYMSSSVNNYYRDASGRNTPIYNLDGFSSCFYTEIDNAFAAWSAVANIKFQKVTEIGTTHSNELPSSGNVIGNIRIGAHYIDGSYSTAAHAYYPPYYGYETSGTINGDIHFDTSESWTCTYSYGKIDIGLVALHEIGHSIGLKHQDTSRTAIMNPSVDHSLTGLQSDDINGARAIYGRASSSGPSPTPTRTPTSTPTPQATATASTGDSYEPDDSYYQASIITSGRPQNHSIIPTDDVDWVKFTLNSSSAVVIETSGDTGGDTRMWLYNSNIAQINYNDDHDGNNYYSRIQNSCTNALAAGTYYVKIDEFANDNLIDNYRISLTVTPCVTNTPTPQATTSAGDSYEPDDSYSQASIITSGRSQNHSIIPVDDVDWVKFTLNSSSAVVIETSGDTGGDTRMWLYNSDIAQLEYDDDDGSNRYSRIQNSCTNALAAGTYYVKVDEYGNSDLIDNYRISLTVTPCVTNTPTPQATTSAGDSYEPDDSYYQASTITSGRSQNHSIVPANDVDWVKFTLNSSSAVVIETSGDTGGDTRMWLYNSNISQIDYNDDNGRYGNNYSHIQNSCTNALAAGTYYIKIDEYGNNDLIDNYSISLSVTTCNTNTPTPQATATASAGDSYEPDDSYYQASTITSGRSQNHSIIPTDDVDWVKFTLNSLSAVVIETSGDTGGDTRMWLYNSNIVQINSNDDGGSGYYSRIQNSCTNALAAGTYYVKVDEYGNNDLIDNYSISLSVTTCNTNTPTPQATATASAGDSYEPDDSYYQASTITSGRSQNHSIIPANDVDWVKFTLNSSSAVVIETAGDTWGDTRMWLYNGNNSQIEYNDDGGNNNYSRIHRSCTNALDAGTYYVKVDEYNNDDLIDNYRISLTVTPCTDSPYFVDVPTTHGFYTYIQALRRVEIINGYGNEYRPNNKVTRGQMSKFVANSLYESGGLSITVSSCSQGGTKFIDIPFGHSFYIHAHCLKNQTIINGYGDGSYKPDYFVNRGQVAKFVANSLYDAGALTQHGFTSVQACGQGGGDFVDVPSGHTFYYYIKCIRNLGIVSGYSPTLYGPEDPVTRGQMAKITYGMIDSINGTFFSTSRTNINVSKTAQPNRIYLPILTK